MPSRRNKEEEGKNKKKGESGGGLKETEERVVLRKGEVLEGRRIENGG